jgi:glycosyltransferase involved in cell wall biosynthesis
MMRITIAFLGNIQYDTRSFNLFHSLESKGHDVRFAGFDWETPDFRTVHSPRLLITRIKKRRLSVFFYARFAALLSCRLFRNRRDLFIASDFYSLPFCAAAARFWNARLIYDAREITSELPAFHDKPFLKRIVDWVERLCVPMACRVFSTGEMDSIVLEEKFGIPKPVLLRNLPRTRRKGPAVSFKRQFSRNVRKLLVYQGILVPGRGIETALEALKKLPEYGLVLLGGGEWSSYYEKKVQDSDIADRVFFAGRISQDKLMRHTAGCDIGLSLINRTCDNNYYALPNKLFEYIMAGLPVIVTDMPQMKSVVETYNVGAVVSDQHPEAVARVVAEWGRRRSDFRTLKKNCRKAALELNWEKEFEKACSEIAFI